MMRRALYAAAIGSAVGMFLRLDATMIHSLWLDEFGTVPISRPSQIEHRQELALDDPLVVEWVQSRRPATYRMRRKDYGGVELLEFQPTLSTQAASADKAR
jgi:hypothetical protein